MANSVLDAFSANLAAFVNTARAKIAQFAAAFVPQAENLIEVGLEDLAELAGAAVLAEAPKVISGQEKFGNATASVVQQVEAAGRTVALQDAQAAVQFAFRDIQKEATGK